MFGYVTASIDLLDDPQKQRYRGWYCGLCKALGSRCGQTCRFTLTYDMAFLAMLLSSVRQLPESVTQSACAVHPFRRHTEIHTQASDYAADMNVILACYKLLDDWHDDRNPAALAAASIFSSRRKRLEQKYPRQTQAIADCLGHLSELEQDGEVNPDLPANCFGRLMGELFVIDPADGLAQPLRSFGRTLGRFIYIMDAATDLRDDLRRERYNPLVGFSSDEIHQMLEIMGGDFMRSFKKLPVTADDGLMGNILCSGIWSRYTAQMKQVEKKEHNTDGKKSV